jgi:hypothetical protein
MKERRRKMTNSEKIKAFLAGRPAITAHALEKEAGIPQAYLSKLRKEGKPITDKLFNRLLPVLKKYGYSEGN